VPVTAREEDAGNDRQIGEMISVGVDCWWSEKAYQIFTTLPLYPGQSIFDLTGENEFEKAKRHVQGSVTVSARAAEM
jgi:hypothetical protein